MRLKQREKRELRDAFKRELGARLALALADERMRQRELASELGSGSADVCEWIHGRREPGAWVIAMCVKLLPSTNVEWLLTGEGPRWKK